MHLLQAQPASGLLLTSETAASHFPAFYRLRTLVGVLDRHLRTNANAVPHYEGRAWCDSIEQQVITGIATCRTAIPRRGPDALVDRLFRPALEIIPPWRS